MTACTTIDQLPANPPYVATEPYCRYERKKRAFESAESHRIAGYVVVGGIPRFFMIPAFKYCNAPLIELLANKRANDMTDIDK